MRKILFSVVAIAGVSVLVFGATQAVWTDTETNQGNVFASGHVDIELDGKGGPTTVDNFFDGHGMIPGDRESAQILIGNRSTGPVSFDVDLVNPVRDGGAPGLDRVLEVRIVQIGDVGDIESPLADKIGDPSDGGFTLWTEGNTGQEIVSFDTTLRDWLDGNVEIGSDQFDLPEGYAGVYEVEVRLAPDAGNDYQNKKFTVDLLVTASSVN